MWILWDCWHSTDFSAAEFIYRWTTIVSDPRDWDCVMYYHPIIFIQYAAGDTANESIREGLFSNLKALG